MSIDLRTASTFGVFGGNGIVNVGNTIVTGDMATYPSSTVTGFPPGLLTGTIHVNNPADVDPANPSFIMAEEVRLDILTAYSEAIGRETTQFTLLGEISNQTLLAGVYDSTIVNPIMIADNSTLTLDAQGVSDAVWIFKVNTGLITGTSSRIILINGAQSSNVYWAVTDGLVSLGNNSIFQGILLSQSPVDIQVTIGAVTGPIFSIVGQVHLNTNTISSFANLAVTGGDPHVICLDNSRIDVYEAGFYRLFDNYDVLTNYRVIVNAEVRRDPIDHIDYYHQIWIQMTEIYPLKSVANRIEFQDQGLSVDNNLQFVQSWRQTYKTSQGQVYKLICEAEQNTVLLTTPAKSIIQCGGLMAGLIQSINDIYDVTIKPQKMLVSQFYDQNGLLAGSHGPHLITCSKISLQPKNGWFRLLQWTDLKGRGILNVRIDAEGQVRELIIIINHNRQKTMDRWQWIGDDHWTLQTFHDHHWVGRLFVDEHCFRVGQGQILLRIQGNGSISCAFHQVDNYVRGLYFGDEIRVYGGYDEFIDELKTQYIKQTSNLTQTNQSIYQRLIENITKMD